MKSVEPVELGAAVGEAVDVRGDGLVAVEAYVGPAHCVAAEKTMTRTEIERSTYYHPPGNKSDAELSPRG